MAWFVVWLDFGVVLILIWISKSQILWGIIDFIPVDMVYLYFAIQLFEIMI